MHYRYGKKKLIAKFQIKRNLASLKDCSYITAFSRHNDWTWKRHYKALDITVNQSLIPAVDIFKKIPLQS